MNIRYFYKKNVEYASIGTPLQSCKLKDVVMHLKDLPTNHEKHKVGSIWFHNSEKCGVEFNPVSEGIVGCDIDGFDREDCDKIMDNFDMLSIVFPCIVCCWYSHSYYDKNKPYGGLHLVIKTDKDQLYYEPENGLPSYKFENIKYSAALAWYIYDICKVDIRPKFREDIKKGSGLDHAMLSIGQQCFLNYSAVTKWNDNVMDVHIDNTTIDGLKQFFSGYKWFIEEDYYRIVSCEVKRFESRHVFSKDFKVTENVFENNQLGHERRIAIENFLAGLGWEFDDIVNFVFRICHGNDFSKGEQNLIRAIRQTSKTAIRKYRDKPSAHYTELAKHILTELGVDIEVEIKKVYQPIDFDENDLFMEVWAEQKDQPYHNVHYNPENYLKIQLTKDQYLTDYKHQITEMINKYQMTYLVADCMVGKTTYALNMQNEYGLFDDSFVVHFGGDTVDVCVPYNSVADNKAKGGRKDIKRVTTADISKFGWEKRNVFIWNTVMPLYDKYFNLGLVKRLVLFFDESQKIVTDDYRWETVFEMFKVLPDMYKHFVFMTGTPAGELEYLKQYFPDYCIIKVDKEIDYNRECKILKYKHFGDGDRVNIIEEAIAAGRLPLIYSNSKKESWENACRTINKRRIEVGLQPYRVLVYSRDNADKLSDVNASNSISGYDIVIATKYCSVGIDFKKDDHRMRSAIIDFASERECTLHDIWQFTLRNRNQDTITKIIVRDDESYNEKLYNYWYYQKFFDDMAKIHTYRMVKPEFDTEESQEAFAFAQEVFQIRMFGRLVRKENNYFNDVRNVKLLGIYYLYRKIFSNINIIKHMLKRRGVEIIEVDMEHTAEKLDNSNRKEIYKWFVDNFNEISNIHSSRREFETISYQIDINNDDVEHIEDNKIYSRSMHYMDWLILQFAGKKEWLPILQEQEYLTKESFAAYNRMMLIAKRITKREIDKIKRFKKVMIQEDINELVVDLISKHYKDLDLTKDEIRKDKLMKDVIEDYKKILRFAIDNIEFIEEIKNATDEGQKISACHKMKIVMDQQEEEKRKKKISGSMMKQYTVKFINTGKVETFNGQDEFMKKFGCSRSTISKCINGETNKLSRMIQLIGIQ